ncbi:MAG: membrane protein insertion efficiency factor YidD [Candidatus Paceibacterota bacterium]
MFYKKNRTIKSLFVFYKKFLSPDEGFFRFLFNQTTPVCVFYPTCSEYVKQSIEKKGLFQGLYTGLKRVLRCHPWQKRHIDLP